jgi:dipeptidyl aminopeptidase/acylaminoacyl peptidase
MLRPIILQSLLLALTSLTAVAQEHPPFSRMDIFELEWVSEPQISPDGKQVVYVRNGMDIMTDQRQSRLWLINSDGSGHEKLTSADVDESGPVWSPDGSRIAFIRDTGHGSEIFLVWVGSGKISRLTQLDRSPGGLSWSPGGSHIAFSMLMPEKPPVLVEAPEKPKDAEWAEEPRITTRVKYETDGSGYIEPGFNHLFIVPAEGGTARQLTSGEFHHEGQPQWTVNGNALIFSANRKPDWELNHVNSEIYRLALDSGEITALTDRNGPDWNPVVSPSGEKIAYLGFDDKVQAYQVDRLYLMDVDGSDKLEIPIDLDRSISGLAWSNDDDGIYFQFDHHGNSKISFTSLAGKTRQVGENLGGESIGRPYGEGSFTVSDKGELVYTLSTPYHPAELAITSRGKSTPRLITGLNEDLLPFRSLGQVKEIWYKSSIDGRDIQGWVVTPPDYTAGQQYPLIVENHGGPISNYGDRFSAEIQLYAAAGYVVFYPNPRGSTSYGEEFGNLLFHNYPGEDYQDVMDGVDAMIKAGYTSKDSLYVTGGSAGGIMTAWIIGKNNRFQAAVVAKPVMNWMSKTLIADNYFQYANYRYPGQPWENPEAYLRFSPISLVGNIETPTMVMVGTADMRTPLSEAKQLYGALKIRGIDTALVEIPDAYHSIVKRPSQLISKADHVLAWFAKYGH